jgi:D-arabinose 1-dehydrogenase-like Zn-dependent alcohol dehydrogenase
VGRVVAVDAGVTHVKEGNQVGVAWLTPRAGIACIAGRLGDFV